MRDYYGRTTLAALTALAMAVMGCSKKAHQEETTAHMPFQHMAADSLRAEMARFAPVEIAYDETILSPSEKEALAKLVQVSHLIDEIYLRQVWYGNIALRDLLLQASEATGTNRALAQDLLRF